MSGKDCRDTGLNVLPAIPLISFSIGQLLAMAQKHKELVFITPRPGCKNGGLDWQRDVKPLMNVLPDNVWVVNPT